MNSYVNLVEFLATPLLWFAIVLCGIVGLLALARPNLLATANSKSSRWIDSRKLFEFFDQQIHIDDFVLKHNKVFGTLSLFTSIGLVVYFLYW